MQIFWSHASRRRMIAYWDNLEFFSFVMHGNHWQFMAYVLSQRKWRKRTKRMTNSWIHFPFWSVEPFLRQYVCESFFSLAMCNIHDWHPSLTIARLRIVCNDGYRVADLSPFDFNFYYRFSSVLYTNIFVRFGMSTTFTALLFCFFLPDLRPASCIT